MKQIVKKGNLSYFNDGDLIIIGRRDTVGYCEHYFNLCIKKEGIVYEISHYDVNRDVENFIDNIRLYGYEVPLSNKDLERASYWTVPKNIIKNIYITEIDKLEEEIKKLLSTKTKLHKFVKNNL